MLSNRTETELMVMYKEIERLVGCVRDISSGTYLDSIIVIVISTIWFNTYSLSKSYWQVDATKKYSEWKYPTILVLLH